MAELAQRLAPGKGQTAHSDLQPPLPTPKPAALAPAWRLVALAAYADCMGAQGCASTAVAAPSDAPAPPPGAALGSSASTTSMATPEMAALEALTRHWLQWHLLAHGGASSAHPDWSVVAVAELALQPGLAQARSHLQSCSWLAALRKTLQAQLPQYLHPEAAMFMAPDAREQAAFIEPFMGADPLQANNWRIYQWIHHIAVPQLIID